MNETCISTILYPQLLFIKFHFVTWKLCDQIASQNFAHKDHTLYQAYGFSYRMVMVN